MSVFIIPTNKNIEDQTSLETTFEVGKRYQIALPQENLEKNIAVIPSISHKAMPFIANKTNQVNLNTSSKTSNTTWQTAKVRSGDSLARIFKRLGFSAKTTHAVSTAKGKETKLLKKLNVGDEIRIASNDNHQLVALEYMISKTETLFVNTTGSGYQSHKETKTVELRESFTQGEIKSNFWNAGLKAKLTNQQIINLANIFGWDIDFALDIREGDTFNVLYENQYVDGEFIGHGKILAAEFINQGDVFQAIRFTDGEYYTPEGKSMRKAFLRAPVNFRYISSNFKKKRFHPIQKRWKAHRGTDYRANKGTPVVAAGNGKITHSTYNKYNGNYVFIQHGNGIVTKYLHFSKRAVKKGQRVKQGQIIGYVGSTGMSQASHLHYEFLLNGVHRNPRTVKLPDAKPINKKYKQAFNNVAMKRIAQLTSTKSALTNSDSTSITED